MLHLTKIKAGAHTMILVKKTSMIGIRWEKGRKGLDTGTYPIFKYYKWDKRFSLEVFNSLVTLLSDWDRYKTIIVKIRDRRVFDCINKADLKALSIMGKSIYNK